MAATGSGLVGCLLLMVTRGVFSMSNCNTESAICAFNGRLQGTILFQEKHGFGCSSFGDADGLHVQIDLQGFDPQDRVTAHNFRIKSFAGLMPNCTGMGADHGQGLRGADLGTYAESKGGVVQISDARLKNGPSLSGAQSIVGRSVAVLKGQDPQARFQTRQVTLGCCIIGVADLQGLAAGNSFGPSNTFNPQPSNTNSFNQPGNNFSPPANTFNPPANTFNPPGSNFNQPGNKFSPPANTFNPPRNNFNQPGNTFNTNPTGGFNNGASGGFNNGGRPAAGGRGGGGGGGFNSFNSQPPASSTYGPFAASAIRRQSAATRPSPQELSGSFTNSAFKSPFALGDRFSFFDLSVPTGIQNGPFGGFSDSGSAFSSPFKSPSASSPGFFDLGPKSDVYSPSTTNFVNGPQQPNLNTNNLNNNNLNSNNINNVNNPVSPQPVPTAPIGNTSQQQGQGLGQGQGQGQVQGQVTPQPGPNPIDNQNQYPDNQNRYPTSQTQYPPNQNQLPNNQNQYPPNQNQYPQNQNQVPPTQNRFPGVSQPPPNQGDQLLEGFSSFPVQASIFQNPLGGPSNGVGTIQGAKAQLGDLFFQGSDKNPAADLLETGLFGSKEYGAGNGQYNPYEDFVEANNNQQPAPAPSNYDNGGNSNNYDDYGGDYADRDYRGGDGGAGGGGGNPDYGAQGNNYDNYDGQDYNDRGSPSSQGGGGPPYDSYPAGDYADYPSQGDSRDYPSGSQDYPSDSGKDYPSDSGRDYPSDSGRDYPTDSRDYPAGNGGDYPSGGNYPIEYPDKGDYPGNRDYSSNGEDYPVSSSYDSDPIPSPYDVKETPQTEPAKTGDRYGPGGGSDSSQPYNGILPGEPTDGYNLPEDDAGDKKAVTYYVNPTTQSVSTNLPVDPNSIPLLDSGVIPTPAGSLGSDNLGPSPSYSADPSLDPSYPSQDPSYPSEDPSYPSTPQPDSTYDELPPTGFSDLEPYAYEGGFVSGISAVGDGGLNRAPTVAGTTSSPVAAFDTPQPIALPPELQRR
ncbi:pro-resilin-like [Littorina saxatilis]|uniref:pro-resilin-like n=1 Tax=Littorina saxatilis TaxID=31220 RepID=UPI0038B673F7